jgi:transposase
MGHTFLHRSIHWNIGVIMKKYNESQRKKIVELYNQGMGLTEIAKKCNTSYGFVKYWTNPEYRKKRKKQMLEYEMKRYKKGITWNQKNPDKVREYTRNYINKRYKSDEDFRKKMIESSKKYQKKRKKR